MLGAGVLDRYPAAVDRGQLAARCCWTVHRSRSLITRHPLDEPHAIDDHDSSPPVRRAAADAGSIAAPPSTTTTSRRRQVDADMSGFVDEGGRSSVPLFGSSRIVVACLRYSTTDVVVEVLSRVSFGHAADHTCDPEHRALMLAGCLMTVTTRTSLCWPNRLRE
jgi:hypothetical protein